MGPLPVSQHLLKAAGISDLTVIVLPYLYLRIDTSIFISRWSIFGNGGKMKGAGAQEGKLLERGTHLGRYGIHFCNSVTRSSVGIFVVN